MTVISVENLGKKYTLRHQQRESYTALRDVITNGVTNLGKKFLSPFTIHRFLITIHRFLLPPQSPKDTKLD